MVGATALTTPPKDLKEAIDWITWVCGYGQGSIDVKKQVALALNHLTNFKTKFNGRFGKVSDPEGLIGNLGKGFQSFLGYYGTASIGEEGIAQSGYQSTYKDASWPSGAENDCAKVFLGVVPFVFWGLGYLYFKCRVRHDGWSEDQLTVSGGWGLGQFMMDMGFTSNTLQNIQGSTVAQRLTRGPDGLDELKNVSPSPYSYSAFILSLETHGPQRGISCPLTNCYVLAKEYFRDRFQNGETIDGTLKSIKDALNTFKLSCKTSAPDLYDQINNFISTYMPDPSSSQSKYDHSSSSSPAGPAVGGFVGVGALGAGVAYGLNLGAAKTLVNGLLRIVDPSPDCPYNLKEAIHWILRVTGKDGGTDNGGTDALTEQVKNLLSEVAGGDPKLGAEIERVTQALGNGGLIAKLAEGLQQFIGYNGNLANNVGKITGAGIAPSNMATHRLCDATIAFTIGVLEGCKSSKEKNTGLTGEHIKSIDQAVGKLYGCYGKGPGQLKNVVSRIYTELTKVKETGEVEKAVRAVGENLYMQLQDLAAADSAQSLASRVGGYLEAVLKAGKATQAAVSGVANKVDTALKELGEEFKPSNIAYNPTVSSVKSKIVAVNIALQSFQFTSTKDPTVKFCLTAGVNAFLTTLKSSNYKATDYDRRNDPSTEINATDAKIFLGCIPVIFNALCFFYWMCEKTSWKTVTLGGHSYDLDIMWFMYSMGYSPSSLNGSKTGSAIVKTAFEKFADLRALSTDKTFYYDFHTELGKKLPENFNGQTNSLDALRALYYCASYYFTYKHSTISAPNKSPSTIREMLYFLAALPFSPELGGCEKHIDSLLQRSIPVSMGGIDPSTRLVLNSTRIKDSLIATPLFSTRILGLLQGTGDSKENSSEPWLHHLFCNGLNLKYPSGSALFTSLSNYTYALQFQLYFLYKQCSGKYTESCGWRDCVFGATVEPTSAGTSVRSHICSTGCTSGTGHTNQHTNDCKHTRCTNSPLQAFLTDNLEGFHVAHQPDPLSHNHLDNHPSGAMCHVKMGFSSETLRKDANHFKGSSIMLTLNYICANSLSPFRRICNYLLFLSKRTPRTLGDLFGFHWQIVAVTDRTSVLNHIMHNTMSVFCGKSEKARLVEKLTIMNGSDASHSYRPHSSADLMSLYYPKCSGTNCGPYLNPITYTTGTIFSRNYASTYLSWVLYLADDFYDWLNELLERFNSVTCESCGHSCDSSGHPNNHGSGQACRCPSITQCADVLPLFYEYGFTMLDAKILKGIQTKRTCNTFHTQLQSVINGDPLYKLLIAVDRFLYAIRWEFFSKLSGFWTIYICLILYTFFFLLDTLHLRYHLKLTASHVIPPLALLTTGKARALTKLTYIGQ
ncbi:variant erythrocyte surface antigen-1 family protein [Babesia caballi]|uniref:Variant erythrocyte surface antigen-1 family protein n=1 Tax=Babesia caballi TaxID=5871 RepID=A0AAV4LTD0_BABCB|nr:variant erythrocyte surface antigen-1 family protein [Babesia caballi]